MAYRFFLDGHLEVEALVAELNGLLTGMVQQSKLEVRFEIRSAAAQPSEFEAPEVLVVFHGRDSELLLQHNAEVLLAMEYLAVRCLRLDPQAYDRIRFDCGEYRATRLAELKLAAQIAAQRVRELHQPFRMNPMPARERRIVHLSVKDEPGIRTGSEGEGEHRQVVIYPADAK
jgi:spoIIIJ-associated protein